MNPCAVAAVFAAGMVRAPTTILPVLPRCRGFSSRHRLSAHLAACGNRCGWAMPAGRAANGAASRSGPRRRCRVAPTSAGSGRSRPSARTLPRSRRRMAPPCGRGSRASPFTGRAGAAVLSASRIPKRDITRGSVNGKRDAVKLRAERCPIQASAETDADRGQAQAGRCRDAPRPAPVVRREVRDGRAPYRRRRVHRDCGGRRLRSGDVPRRLPVRLSHRRFRRSAAEGGPCPTGFTVTWRGAGCRSTSTAANGTTEACGSARVTVRFVDSRALAESGGRSAASRWIPPSVSAGSAGVPIRAAAPSSSVPSSWSSMPRGRPVVDMPVELHPPSGGCRSGGCPRAGGGSASKTAGPVTTSWAASSGIVTIPALRVEPGRQVDGAPRVHGREPFDDPTSGVRQVVHAAGPVALLVLAPATHPVDPSVATARHGTENSSSPCLPSRGSPFAS